tara:strand:+ start:620 stop:1441 length:822 start_codon:yes stop_codon:yes gene_type:complete
MKFLIVLGAALAAATTGYAQNWGGNISANLGFGSVSADSSTDTIDGAYSRYGVNGSVGFALGGNFGVQLDAGYEAANTSSDDYYEASAFTLHANMPLGGFTVGAFYGFGTGDHPYDSDYGDVSWYGVEAASILGQGTIAAQLGLMDSASSHSSLDYSSAFFANVEYRYFINDNFMLRGNAGFGNFLAHGDPGTGILLAADATYGLGRNFYLTAGVRDFIVTNDGEGSYNDLSAHIGITMAFGGNGSLRDSMASTPMIATMLPSLVAVASSAVD